MKKPRYRRIGILGGMGPRATADLYLAIVALFQRRYGAKYDADFPQILINSVPAPDVVERVADEAKLVELLGAGVQTLERAGAEFIAMACNTVHVYHAALAARVSIPVLNLVEETLTAVQAAGHDQVGLLGTGLTVRRGLYREGGARRGLTLIEPRSAEQERLTALILEVLAGSPREACAAGLARLITGLQERRAQAVILGCTDLSGLAPDPATVAIFDTTEVLARAVVREAVRPSDRD